MTTTILIITLSCLCVTLGMLLAFVSRQRDRALASAEWHSERREIAESEWCLNEEELRDAREQLARYQSDRDEKGRFVKRERGSSI